MFFWWMGEKWNKCLRIIGGSRWCSTKMKKHMKCILVRRTMEIVDRVENFNSICIAKRILKTQLTRKILKHEKFYFTRNFRPVYAPRVEWLAIYCIFNDFFFSFSRLCVVWIHKNFISRFIFHASTFTFFLLLRCRVSCADEYRNESERLRGERN